MNTPRRDTSLLSHALIGVLAFAVFALTLLAADPSAHRHVHCDADSADHACAVTLFANDGVAAVASTLAIVLAWVIVGFLGLQGSERLRSKRCSLWPWALGPPLSASV